jgi:alpha-L-rhamnosidase
MAISPERLTLTAALTAGLLGPLAPAADFPEDPLAWPPVTATNKPWTRWWWLGSAVDKPNLTRELEDFAKTGLGGVEICPIYGAKGAEDRFLKFLSPAWMDRLAHTTTEAKRLGLGVDMTTGTGWPFGGPQVTPEIASVGLTLVRETATGGTPLKLDLPDGKTVCLRAFPETGEAIDLTHFINDGKLDWQPPAGKWNILGLVSTSPIQQVKRAAPGGEGNVLDPFSATAMESYLKRFDDAFATFTAPMPRAQFHDSFEYYAAEWTPAFLDAFLADRGYDLRDQLPAFAGIGDAETVSRVRADYRETLSGLHLAYLKRWHDWAKSRGGITRNQAHGSPGNLLDHYAVSEIPETEIFKHVEESQIPMMRMAASAAHSAGGNLVSAETFTWLDEHFQVTPEKLKEAADFVFLSGANHLFFHGIPHSPEDAKWPGWLFYASTHMGPNGGLWRDLPAFTAYLQRCQSILQEGSPSQDVLLYYPIHDLWHNQQEKLPLFTLHNQDEWLWPTKFYQTSMELWNGGITFSYASGDMLSRASVKDGKVLLGGHAYGALVLPGVKRMTPDTLGKIAELTRQGAKLIIQDALPADVPGLHRNAERREELASRAKDLTNSSTLLASGESILPTLSKLVPRETMTSAGLRFIRRTHEKGHHYFVVNRSDKAFNGILPLAVPFKSAAILDPWNPQETVTLAVQESGVPVRLEPGQSIIIRTFTDAMPGGQPWTASPARNATTIEGPWKIAFIEGGPSLPPAAENTALGTWTNLPATRDFSGTARYTTTFDFNGESTEDVLIDLGKVGNTARVSLNGQSLGISWCAPHLVSTGNALNSGKNLLEIEVTNLAANRIAALDRSKAPWKQFHEINFVNIDYKPFDAAAWPALESGLLGPVKLLVPEK